MNQGLLITAIGMGLVFVMIIALWGIMALLTALTQKAAEREAAEDAEDDAEADEASQDLETSASPAEAVGAAAAALAASEEGQLAAAIAVAYALAKERRDGTRSILAGDTPKNPGASAWLSAGRVQQTYGTGR